MTRHLYSCNVRFSDVDAYGHVNNVKYFEYYQEARLAFLASLGHVGTPDQVGLVVARVDVDYRRPVLFRREPYAVATWVTRVGGSSFTLAAQIEDGQTVLSCAQAILVGFDAGSQRSRPLSDSERERLRSALDGGVSPRRCSP